MAFMFPLRAVIGAVALAVGLYPDGAASLPARAPVERGHVTRETPIRCAVHPKMTLHQLKHIEALATLAPVLSKAESLGNLAVAQSYDCTLTAYGPGFESTGKHPGDPGYGITASGKVAQPRHTIAVDPGLIPLGSLVYINGVGYRVAEDIGGAIKGKHIDVFFASDSEARLFGVKQHVKVFLFARGSDQ